MTQKQKLNQKLWDIANNFRGKMGADEFRDYTLGFIFYKYLSEKMLRYANEILAPDNMTYHSINLIPKPRLQHQLLFPADCLLVVVLILPKQIPE